MSTYQINRNEIEYYVQGITTKCSGRDLGAQLPNQQRNEIHQKDPQWKIADGAEADAGMVSYQKDA